MRNTTQGKRPCNVDLPFLAFFLVLLSFLSLVSAAGPEIGLGNGELMRRGVPETVQSPTGETSLLHLFGRAETDDHTCTKERECKNKACCGSSGICGYGPSYCGIGCTSNCDAKAECGQYSADGKTKCPLNVCCSQFGFCGTEPDFCDPGSGCQSNCGNPSSPGSGGNVRTQIIGYYESWSSYSGRCGSLQPSQIPVSALNILNFAFAYISPHDLEIIPMVGEDGSSLDDQGAAKLYTEVTAAKLRNPNLGVWLAIGGWTFSDNNTMFQPVFGQIAGSSIARRQFAQNLVNFMTEYGFDGVDIDWEYPGAPDRGGSDDDIENFPLLLSAIRKAFNDNGHGKWGISFTAPSSYWYLRWFNLPELVKDVNFVNLMSYDLHGIWDKTNEIGSQILAHTNLTEVDRALELFWRNNIDPALINLGVAFYGRSYKLEDASCSKPGCRFSGPGEKGKCSNTAGYLSYREIMEKIADAKGKAEEIWDKEAGVKMVVYDDNNWISYDDSTTFQQKVDFANERGLSGLMIWAIDQDDDHFDALQALTNKRVDSVIPESDLMGEFDLSRCYYTSCGGQCSPHSGFKEMTRLNLNDRGDGCPDSGKNSKQRALCCPPWGAPDPATCHWTKSCSDNCKDGEVILALDNYGGGGWCSVNKKEFCCPASNVDRAVHECEWFHGSKCPDKKPQYLTWSGVSSLCCPATPKFKTKNCNWHGSPGFCTNSECPVGQITVAQSSWATPIKDSTSSSNGCWLGGKKSFCCDAPYGENAAGTLPVPLEDLFPEYKEIPAADEAAYEEALDANFSFENEPDKAPFAWVVFVGPPESVQSLDKRDGSALETFDCPNPDLEDYGVQSFKAVCTADTDDHDCEDLLLGGGAHGTIARLPSSCGPDEWVRVVSFQEVNATVPHHLVKRVTPGAKVYEIKYDYKIRDVANDEIFVRIDSSTHHQYWSEVVASHLQQTKRGEAKPDWREPHNEWFRQHEIRKRGAGDLSWWKNIFSGFLKEGAVASSEHAEYRFDEPLYQASISCPPHFDASASVRVAGGLVANIDWGVSLIGRVKDTKFEQAYAFFSINEIDANAQIYIDGEAQFTFESQEMPLLTNFAPWGGSFNIKGLVSIGPFMDVTAQIDAIATLSGHFGSGVTISNRELLTGKATPLTWMYPPSMDVLPDSELIRSGMYPGDTTIKASRKVSVAAKGSVGVTLTPSLAFKIQVDVNGALSTNTHITAAFPNRMVMGVGTDESCNDGLQYWMDYEQKFELITNAPALGWDMEKKRIYEATKQMVKPQCYKFTEEQSLWTREEAKGILDSNRGAIDGSSQTGSKLRARDDTEPDVNPRFPDPTGSCLVCARDTYMETSPCGPLFDEEGNELDPDCEGTGESGKKTRTVRDDLLRQEYKAHLKWFKERSLIMKRSTKAAFDICHSGTSRTPRISVAKLNFPSSGELLDGKGGPNIVTYAPDSRTNMLNYNFDIQPTPAKTDSRSYNAEHVLEHQTVKEFLIAFTTKMKGQGIGYPNAASQSFIKSKPLVRDSWLGEQGWDFCEHLKFWLDMIPLQATWYDDEVYEGALSQTIMKALPHYDGFASEMTLLDLDTNSVKEAAWNDGVEDVRRVGTCIAKNPPNYAGAICSMRKAIFAIRYHQLVQDTLVTQAQRVADWFDDMEDAAESFQDEDYVRRGQTYTRLHISSYWKKWMYDHTATAGTKLAGLLNEHIEDVKSRIENSQPPQTGNPAGGGTTTGAQQGNQALVQQAEHLRDGYAAYGPWAYRTWPNPFHTWVNERSL